MDEQQRGRPASIIRQTYAFHTGPEKRWSDVCYHFMIGPDGSIWEARAGSTKRAVRLGVHLS